MGTPAWQSTGTRHAGGPRPLRPVSGPICKHEYEEKEKEICHYEPEKECETKTETYTLITGYEDGEDCKDVEVCKSPYRRKRSAKADPHYGGYFIECEKETKNICNKVPVKEEKSNDFELCRLKPKKVCEMKTIKV